MLFDTLSRYPEYYPWEAREDLHSPGNHKNFMFMADDPSNKTQDICADDQCQYENICEVNRLGQHAPS